MSTASEGIPTDQPPRTGHQPGALAFLTATALGGLIATRLNKTPLVLAAGAAALALLNQKKAPASRTTTPPRPPEPVPPPPEMAPQTQIEQWLTRQIVREEQAPVIELPLPSAASFEPEDNYTPQSLLIDDAEENTAVPPSRESFAHLTEPVRHVAAPPPPVIVHEPDLPALQALEATESCPTLDAAWLLGIEPLPSVHESPAPQASVSSMFTAAPVPMEKPVPPPVFSAPVFEGRALPDEIEVAPPVEPVVHLTPALAPAPAAVPAPEAPPQAPLEVEVMEIPVQLAAPGEASFDPPLTGVPHDPWQPLAESPLPAPAAVTPPPPFGPVIEAEIILRPRAPTQTTVIAKGKPISPRFAANLTAPETLAPEAAVSENPALPRAPIQSLREQRPRKTWRSWWRGD
ncbi:hypothetical protein [Prosthecobacter sp.]|uniref:hypothetical protein n=1 Tax=Prosthecobacter sp. TaxID=1965333 RepID=UPI002ABB8792|nr:hypothetical protein [Prosthecobacter sp.]MDZ4401134.1 hypothetical protein [Prosthecobacter sp.]